MATQIPGTSSPSSSTSSSGLTGRSSGQVRQPSYAGPNQSTTDLEVMTSQISDAIIDYGKKQPGVVACMIFAAGFFVGWKIKPW